MQPGTYGKIRPPRRPSRHPTVSTTTADGSSLRSISDPLTVFQKAFWRRPEDEDLMLHAERREWSTKADVVRHWQWFIACRPGPEMLDWLAPIPFRFLHQSWQPMLVSPRRSRRWGLPGVVPSGSQRI